MGRWRKLPFACNGSRWRANATVFGLLAKVNNDGDDVLAIKLRSLNSSVVTKQAKKASRWNKTGKMKWGYRSQNARERQRDNKHGRRSHSTRKKQSETVPHTRHEVPGYEASATS